MANDTFASLNPNQPKFTFVPSLPWIGLGLRSLSRIQLELAKIVPQHGIELILDAVTAIDPHTKQITLQSPLQDLFKGHS